MFMKIGQNRKTLTFNHQHKPVSYPLFRKLAGRNDYAITFAEMRSQKQQTNNTERFLTPTVNSYKLHLTAVKSLIPEKPFHRLPDGRWSKDFTKYLNMDAMKINSQRQDSRLHACTAGGRPLYIPVPAFVSEFKGPERTLQPPAAVHSRLMGDLGPQSHRVKPRRATHSAGAIYSHGTSRFTSTGLGETLSLSENSTPGFPIAFCSHDECGLSTERLDLDRRGLEECPMLEGMERLRLLNFQHNLIMHIQNLSHLRRLIFLDLYDNRISEMSGISALASLRVLMLGKNRIQRICCLDNLTKLDVLDLHGNKWMIHLQPEILSSMHCLCWRGERLECCLWTHDGAVKPKDHQWEAPISQIENLSHLSELRVLNLAGNCISCVNNLQGLHSLTELNLQCNCISTVTEVDLLPCLQRLFLSCNRLTSFDDLACLGDSCSLSELTLDGNPVALETWYKQAALRCVLQLRQLDMKRVTEEERRMACIMARKEDEKKRDSHKQAMHKSPAHVAPQQFYTQLGLKSQDSSVTSKEKRRLAIRNAAQQWEGVRSCLELPVHNGSKEEVSPEASPAHSPAQTNGLALEPSPDEQLRVSPLSAPERPPGGSENRLRSTSRPNSPRDPKLLEAGGASVQSLSLSDSHLAELDGETLRLFGSGALEALERGWGVQTAGAVTVIAFRYIHFDAIVPTLPRIRVKFPNLSHLIFLETNICRLPQLAALAQLRRLDQLTIHPEGNPVVSLSLWRAFIIYRLHHFNLHKINGLEVTMNDVISAERLFGTLGHIAATETPRCRLLVLLEESRKRQLQFLLEGRGRRSGLSPEELRDNGKLLGEGLSRALFNYPSKDCCSVGPDSPEEGAMESSSERKAMMDQYLQELVQRASDTNLKGDALHKLWPSLFVELVKDCVLEMRDRPAFRRACLNRLSTQEK
ncbi:leucine-rich repeat-containing protein 49 isoform X2 [Esox lucius]|uniref:leucine-rich repeat-containing protein 49 isoform X2 n=1 Tax=Esox lucius TaxID=8010 RepID=UPI0014769789|nr:leucine-rich repeat-containing protein 49 isoform X2 [Esox lucius]